MKSFREKAQQRKGPSLSSGVHSNFQWPSQGGRARERESKGAASKVRENQKHGVPWKQQKGGHLGNNHNYCDESDN